MLVPELVRVRVRVFVFVCGGSRYPPPLPLPPPLLLPPPWPPPWPLPWPQLLTEAAADSEETMSALAASRRGAARLATLAAAVEGWAVEAEARLAAQR